MRVHIIQLMKGSDTSELTVLRSIKGITLERCDRSYGFFSTMTDDDKAEITECHNKLLEKGYSLVRSGEVDMLIVDEFNSAYSLGLLDREKAEQFFDEKPNSAEIVIYCPLLQTIHCLQCRQWRLQSRWLCEDSMNGGSSGVAAARK